MHKLLVFGLTTALAGCSLAPASSAGRSICRIFPPRSQPARCLRISDGADVSPIHGYRPISPPRSRIMILPSRSQRLRRRGRNTGYRMQSIPRLNVQAGASRTRRR